MKNIGNCSEELIDGMTRDEIFDILREGFRAPEVEYVINQALERVQGMRQQIIRNAIEEA